MILCCGEALIDMLPRQSTRGEPAFAPYPGGAVFNSAIALGRLGVPVEFFSGLSSDLFGEMLRGALEESGVGTRHVATSDQPTTLAFVNLVDGQARYVFYDEASAGRLLSLSDLPTLGSDVKAMLFGGISLIPEPSGSTYESLMAREHGTRATMLDANIRPSLIPNRVSHHARLMRMAAMADIVKVSDEDLAWFGDTNGTDAMISNWIEHGVRLIVVTHGSGGATGHTASGAVHIAAPEIDVVDTIGAGDTFNAGVLASLQEQGLLSKDALSALTHDQLRVALDLGARAAAITVSRAGANPPWRTELS